MDFLKTLSILAAILCMLMAVGCSRGIDSSAAPDKPAESSRGLEQAAALSAEGQAAIVRANALGTEAQQTEDAYAENDLLKEREEIARQAGVAADRFRESSLLFGEAASKLDAASRLPEIENALKIYFKAKSREYRKQAELVELRSSLPQALSQGKIQSLQDLQQQAEELSRRAAKVQAEKQKFFQEAEDVRKKNAALFQEISSKLPS